MALTWKKNYTGLWWEDTEMINWTDFWWFWQLSFLCFPYLRFLSFICLVLFVFFMHTFVCSPGIPTREAWRITGIWRNPIRLDSFWQLLKEICRWERHIISIDVHLVNRRSEYQGEREKLKSDAPNVITPLLKRARWEKMHVWLCDHK